jgi:hypothetical protein
MTNELVSTKYTFACDPDECDCLIEVTSSDGFGFPSGTMEMTCPCGRKTNLLSVHSATIQPNLTKEEKMEDTTYGATVTPVIPESYNANLLVTYKVIRGYSDPEYATEKVTSLEWDLHNGRENSKHNAVLQSKIDTVKEIITEAYEDSEDKETLRAIVEALNIELTKNVTWTANIEVSGSIDIDLFAEYPTDLDSEIEENLYVESQSGNIQIDEQYVTNVREC